MSNNSFLSNRLATVTRVYDGDPLFNIVDEVFYVPEVMAAREAYNSPINFDAIATHYGSASSSRERVATLVNPDDISTDSPLRLQWVTAFESEAHKKSPERMPLFPLAALGIAITEDNKFMLGIRNGPGGQARLEAQGDGLYGLAPGGALTFKSHYNSNPVLDVLLEEGAEELGTFNFRPGTLEGVARALSVKLGPSGVKFVGSLYVDTTSNELIAFNDRYNAFLNGILPTVGNDWKKARAEMKIQHAEFPADIWEHRNLRAVDNNPDAIEKILTDEIDSLAAIGAAGLMVHRAYLLAH